MEESTGFLLLIPVLAFSIWLVSYSGSGPLAAAQMSAAVQRGADAAAVVLEQTPEGITAAALSAAAEQRAIDVVSTAAIGVCDAASPQFSINMSLIKLAEPVAIEPEPATIETAEQTLAGHVVVVKAICPLLGVSPNGDAVRVVAISNPFNNPQISHAPSRAS